MLILAWILSLVVVFGVAWLGHGWWVTPDPPDRSDETVRREVCRAYYEAGLPLEQFSDEFNLARTGKLTEVYHRAAQTLGVDPEFDTVGDVIKWLRE